MFELITRLIDRYWDGFAEAHELFKISMVADVFTMLFSIPLTLIGLVWLIFETDLTVLSDNIVLVVILVLVSLIVERFRFHMLSDIGNISGGATFTGSFSPIITWTSILLLGATGIWLIILRQFVTVYLFERDRLNSLQAKINLSRNLLSGLSTVTFSMLVGLSIIQALGGDIPLQALDMESLLIGSVGIYAAFFINEAWTVPYLIFATHHLERITGSPPEGIYQFTLQTILFTAPIQVFALLAAGTYVIGGWIPFLMFISALVLSTLLASRLSETGERMRQRTQELDKLERLGQAIIQGPPDASTLPDLLNQYVPMMFAQSAVAICLFPDKMLLQHPAEIDLSDRIIAWAKKLKDAGYVKPRQPLPWNKSDTASDVIAYAPILDEESGKAIGFIHVQTIHRDIKGIVYWLPAIQSLAAQISSALHSAEVYRRDLEHEKTRQELALAGRIQNSFLPHEVPKLDGWQVTAALTPARETSGDFYDFIELDDGKLGIIVADVADKGVGAALYMALSRTLIRTYATAYPDEPARALFEANERILSDTQSDLFVTLFYGVLNLATGEMIYCNAGHNPGFWHHSGNGQAVDSLGKTGIPLGMFNDYQWKQDSIQIQPQDLLILYSDGLTEAQNLTEDEFGEDRLLTIIEEGKTTTTTDIHNRIISEVTEFRGEAAQFDDITLMMVRRN